jgi:hypothetical protein
MRMRPYLSQRLGRELYLRVRLINAAFSAHPIGLALAAIEAGAAGVNRLNPSTMRSRRKRARDRETRLTRSSVAGATDATLQGVACNADPPEPSANALISAKPASVAPVASASAVTFPDNVKGSYNEPDKQKNLALQREPRARGPASAELPEPGTLGETRWTPAQIRRYRWLRSTMEHGQQTLPWHQSMKLGEALTNEVIIAWVEKRGRLPAWAKHSLEALHRQRKGLPDAQRSMLLPIAGDRGRSTA